MSRFDPLKYGFEILYETGIGNPTWIYTSDCESYYDWKYIISCPEISSHRDIDEKTKYKIRIFDGDEEFIVKIKSDESAKELFVKLKMKHIKYVKRELLLENILNKNDSR